MKDNKDDRSSGGGTGQPMHILPEEVLGNLIGMPTRANEETETKAKFTVFGMPMEEELIPIDEVCSICDHWKKKGLGTVEKCRAYQKKGAELRGFKKVICPNQFKTEHEKELKKWRERNEALQD